MHIGVTASCNVALSVASSLGFLTYLRGCAHNHHTGNLLLYLRARPIFLLLLNPSPTWKTKPSVQQVREEGLAMLTITEEQVSEQRTCPCQQVQITPPGHVGALFPPPLPLQSQSPGQWLRGTGITSCRGISHHLAAVPLQASLIG